MTSAEDSCPHCGAVVRPDAPWCTLCLASLRPVVVPEAAPSPDALTAPLEQVLAPAATATATDLDDRPSPAPPSPALPAGSPAPVAAPVAAPRRGRHAAARDDEPLDPGWSQTPDSARDGSEEESVDVMLSLLRAEHAKDDAVPFASAMSERSTRVMVIGVGMVGLTLLGLVVLLVLGQFA
jgi:hypothetical protein